MKFTIYQNSRQGPRPHNEDRLAYSYSRGALLMVIADGMGGHRHGEIAAELAVKTLTESFQNLAIPTLANPYKFLEEHILQVHDALDSIALRNNLDDAPGTTVVAAVLQNDKLYAAHVGDSRLYHFRNGQPIFRTEDHSVVQMLYRKGQIKQEEMAGHPDLHVIYNCLGSERMPDVELTGPQKLMDGDIIFLCSDGIWTTMDDAEMARLLFSGNIQDSVPELLDMAESLCGKSGDNMSAIGLQWGSRQSGRSAISTATMPLGMTTTMINPIGHFPELQKSAHAPDELSDEEIEKKILEIQSAIRKSRI
jgi:serine/threonine protein phosphatase PrpC